MQIISAQTDKDLAAIAAVAGEIWHEHYTPIIGKAQVVYMIDKFQSLQAMQAQIAEGYEYFSFLLEGKLVGYLAFQARENHLFLSKVYLLKEHRAKGLGKTAFAFTEARAKKLGLSVIQLTVNKFNINSIAAYERSGYKKIRPAIFDIGNGYVMDDFVMEKWVNEISIL